MCVCFIQLCMGRRRKGQLKVYQTYNVEEAIEKTQAERIAFK